METIVAMVVGVLAVTAITGSFGVVLFRVAARDREMLEGRPPAAPVVARPTESQAAEEAEPAPVGTLAIMVLYLMVIVGLWGTAYAMLLQRG